MFAFHISTFLGAMAQTELNVFYFGFPLILYFATELQYFHLFYWIFFMFLCFFYFTTFTSDKFIVLINICDATY